MANINRNEIGRVFKDALGRSPNEAEFKEWTSISHFDPRWGDPSPAAAHGKPAFNILRNSTEGQEYVRTGRPAGDTKIAGDVAKMEAGAMSTTGPGAVQTTGTQPNVAQPTQYTQPTQGYTPTTTYDPAQYSPTQYAPSGQYQPTYQPAMSASGDVAAYMPPGYQMPGVDPETVAFPEYSEMAQPGTFMPPVTLESGFPGVPAFNFDFSAEQQKAYQKLKPFYDKLLSFSGGRLDLAKRIIEYTYQQGMRESSQEYGQARREQELVFPQEQEQQQTTQNQRGILESGFGQTERGRLKESQGLRREAIDRALENRDSRLSSQRGFGLEEKQKGFTEERFGLERERRNESQDLAQDVFGLKKSGWESQLQKAAQEEQRKLAKEQMDFAKEQFEWTKSNS